MSSKKKPGHRAYDGPTRSTTPQHKTERCQLRGWFKVFRDDRAKIIDHCEGTTLACLSVWDALSDLSNEHRSASFNVSVGIIRKRAGTSRSTTFRALDLLEELGMLSRKQNLVEGQNALQVSSYTLLTPSLCETTQSESDTRPSPSNFKIRDTEVRRTSPSGKKKEKKRAASQDSACLPKRQQQILKASEEEGTGDDNLPSFLTWNP